MMSLPKGEVWNLESLVVSRLKGMLYDLDALNVCICMGWIYFEFQILHWGDGIWKCGTAFQNQLLREKTRAEVALSPFPLTSGIFVSSGCQILVATGEQLVFSIPSPSLSSVLKFPSVLLMNNSAHKPLWGNSTLKAPVVLWEQGCITGEGPHHSWEGFTLPIHMLVMTLGSKCIHLKTMPFYCAHYISKSWFC